MTPIAPDEIILGECLWGASKAFLGVLGLTSVAFIFGYVQNLMIIPALLLLFLCAWLYAALALVFDSLARNYDSFSYFNSGIIIPMSLFCGTFFPITDFPQGLKVVLLLLPQTHAVMATRTLLVNGWDWSLLFNLTVLLLYALVFTNIALIRVRKILIS